MEYSIIHSKLNSVQIPDRIIWVILLICIMPVTLNIMGVDFGLVASLDETDHHAGRSDMANNDVMLHLLHGAFTHTILEWTAFCVAIFTVTLAFSHFKITRNLSTAIIGASLFAAGCMDAFHTLAADRLIDAVADNKDLMPFTWVVSRTFNALILIVGAGLLLSRKKEERPATKQLLTKQSSTVYITITGLLFAVIAYAAIHYSAISNNLPRLTFPDELFSRPYDVLPLLLYLMAGLFIFPRLYQRYPSLFAHALIISMVPHALTQLHMVFGSTELFDNHFNIAHFLKIIAYVVPLIGLSLDYIRTYHCLQEEVMERSDIENALRESEVRQRAVLETMSDAQITMDEIGTIESINPATEAMFGYIFGELVGNNIKKLMPEPYRDEHDYFLSQYLHTGESHVIGQQRDVAGLRKNGEIFPIELSVNEMWVNNKRMYSGILKDMTSKKQAEEKLADFKKTLDLTMDCVFMFDPVSLKFFYVNKGATEQVGYSNEELMKMSPVDIKPDVTMQQFNSMIEPMISGHKNIINFETVHQHKDGTRIPVEIFLQYINPPGAEPRFVAIVRDITERKRVDKMKNEFVSTVSHELRTPLTSIRGSLGLISGGAVGEVSEKAQSLLTIANNNTGRLLLLINDILDMEKIESGNMTLDFSSIQVNEFLKEAISANLDYGSQLDVNIKIICHIGNEVEIIADKNRLMQVLNNLLSNAIKFSPSGGIVVVEATTHENKIRICVSDKGEGVPEEFQPKLFDKFTQSDSSDTRSVNGTGLGLNIAKAIVEEHGGQIGFDTKPGIGTTFYVDFPKVAQSSLHINVPVKQSSNQ